MKTTMQKLMNKKLIDFMADMKEEKTPALVQDLLKEGANPLGILADARSARTP